MANYIKYTEFKKNRPIASVMRDYADKNSGKVVDSRMELQRRFAYQDWPVQKKILSLFLRSGKNDRAWAYSRLLQLWDKDFEEEIIGLWEAHHEEKCAWVVIRHCPTEYVEREVEALSSGRNYYYICKRLRNSINQIDRSRLSDSDYLDLLVEMGGSIDIQDALDIMYKLVHDRCTHPMDNEDIPSIKNGDVMTMVDFPHIRKALDSLYLMGCRDVANAFEAWNLNVRERICKSPEFNELQAKGLNASDYRIRAVSLCFIYSYLSLDDKYKMASDPTIEQMEMPVSYYRIATESELNLMRNRLTSK